MNDIYVLIAIVLRPNAWALLYSPALLLALAFFPHELLTLQSTRPPLSPLKVIF